jgi:hypothetical protein
MRQYLPEVFLHRALTAHLHMRGYQVREEVPFGNVRFDTIAFDGSRVVGYEVKINSWAKALKQALVYKLCCDAVYIVVPAGCLIDDLKRRCLCASVGLVTIGPPPEWSFRVILDAPTSTIRNQIHHANIQRIAAFR